jgi:phosphoribosyl-AMP cyclohydrolase / phosphoribosyl-ATP pyrophosphohydrolase
MRDRHAPLSGDALQTLAWDKMDGLIPAIVQHRASGAVLMLGYMNPAALAATLESGYATFFSRSRGALWRKGETSGNGLRVAAIHADCDGDALLLLADPEGPTCHLGTASCFAGARNQGPGWLAELSATIRARAQAGSGQSYTARLLGEGPQRIAQKVGEEGVEVALAGAVGDAAALREEGADLLYHLAVLLEARGLAWADLIETLQARTRSAA